MLKRNKEEIDENNYFSEDNHNFEFFHLFDVGL